MLISTQAIQSISDGSYSLKNDETGKTESYQQTCINLRNGQTIYVSNGFTLTLIDDQHSTTGEPMLEITI